MYTRVAFYISELENKKQILIIENCFIVFQNIPPLRSIHFCMPFDQLSKHFSHFDWGISKTWIPNASTASSGAKSAIYGERLIKSIFWVLKNTVVWANVCELALSWWRVIRLRRLVFLISWKTTGKQMVVYHSKLTVLCCSSGTIATC